MSDVVPPSPDPSPSVPPPSSPPPVPGSPEANAKLWCMLTHLSALSGFVGIPFGNILGPLIIWQIKKTEIPAVEAHGKEALNFQITITIAALVLGTVGMLICIGPLIALAVVLAAAVFTIIAGIKANNGEFYKYPLTWRVIK